MSYYKHIFLTNLLQQLEEKKMSKSDLAKLSSVSPQWLSGLAAGNANPSLKIMEALASALQTSLPYMLTNNDLSEKDRKMLDEDHYQATTPPGHEWVSVLLPEHQAFIVKKWAKTAEADLKKK